MVTGAVIGGRYIVVMKAVVAFFLCFFLLVFFVLFAGRESMNDSYIMIYCCRHLCAGSLTLTLAKLKVFILWMFCRWVGSPTAEPGVASLMDPLDDHGHPGSFFLRTLCRDLVYMGRTQWNLRRSS